MKEKHPVLFMIMILGLGELAVAGLTVLGFFLVSLSGQTVFDYTVLTGALLGAAVMVLNFAAMAAYTGRTLDNTLAEREKTEMTEEEAADFTAAHRKNMELRIRLSQTARLFVSLGVLVLAFLTPWFNVVAALIPLLGFRPILMLYGRFCQN